MIITTKYNIDDYVVFKSPDYHVNLIGKVTRIEVEVNATGITVSYWLYVPGKEYYSGDHWVDEYLIKELTAEKPIDEAETP